MVWAPIPNPQPWRPPREINPFTARSGHNFFPQRSLYPTCIQAQRTVKASNRMRISNHIDRHSTINTGRIRSNQITQSSTISERVRWSMGLMFYSNRLSLQRSAVHRVKASVSDHEQSMVNVDGSLLRHLVKYTYKTFPSYY
jgi:hypothetical protein